MPASKNKSTNKSSKSNSGTRSGGNQNANQRSGNRYKANTVTGTIIGGCPDLKGSVYYCTTHRQADRFIQTTKAIVEYVGRTFQHSGDIRATLENESLFRIPIPADPAEAFEDILDEDNINN